jgi:hypothetical protein
VRVRIWLINNPVLAHEQDRKPRITGRIESFTRRLKGRIVVVTDVDGALKRLTGTSTGGLIDALFAMEGSGLKET